jgi:2-amino-4-hydroxy-6-hydroxymethyldihydropteridine diphosphokinase
MTRAVVALGSNLGDRGATVIEAVRLLAAVDGVEVTAASSLIETVALTPHGRDESAPGYLNGVVLVDTTLDAEALLDAANAIEAELGRVRGERWADRTIDIDLVDYEGVVLDTPRLTLPHPRAAERDFVLRPWLEVDPLATLGGVPIAELVASL